MHSDLWPWLTVTLSGLLMLGYSVIAFNWYFQAKFASAQSRAATARLRAIVVCCAVFGFLFYTADMSWRAWRIYDAALFVLAYYTWSYAIAMRGLGLVDERLAQVQELERSATKYREIAELLPQVVWTANAHGHVDYSNQRWIEYAGDRRAWLDVIHPDEREPVGQWWRLAVIARAPVSREIRLCGPEGYRTFIVRATPIVHGDAIKWLGACADIEDQKRHAAERESQARQKVFFLNALSHDLRAPLHNVVLNAHLLRMTVQERVDADSVNVILENAVAAGDLVTRLLDFARAGEEKSSAERVSMAAILHQVARRFQPAAQRKGLHLRAGGERDAEVVVDRHKLERVLGNLVDNAIKFTHHGDVRLELAAFHDRVTVRVSDSGIGIPESSVPFLFDEFYQVSNHERDRSKGFGIGLAICRSLARQLGGDVQLVRTGHDGSCFELVLLGQTGISPGGGGRPDGPAGHLAHSEEPGLCRI